MHVKWLVPGDATATIEACAQHFIDCYKRAVKEHGTFFVALSGGSTPKTVYEKLTGAPYASQIDWSKIHLFWSDERSVEPTSPDSNYHMAMEAGFKKMPIPPAHIQRMCAERDIEKNAAAYEKKISRPFDLILLGMGEDGHTASLFPGTEALAITDRLVAANYVPQKETWRMTLTFPCINQAKEVVIYVIGSSKKERVYEVLTNAKLQLPIQKVGTAERPALWILDKSAAELILK